MNSTKTSAALLGLALAAGAPTPLAAANAPPTPASASPAAAPGDTGSGGSVKRLSVDSAGRQANGGSGVQQTAPAMSGNGRAVAFESLASNLVPGDSNRAGDVFVRDRGTGKLIRVSVGPGGRQADAGSTDPTISADGRFVGFTSAATNLVPGDTNRRADVFVHDLLTRTTRRASVGAGGRQGNGNSFFPVLSADGSAVAFQTHADNLATPAAGGPRDTNRREDVYCATCARGQPAGSPSPPGSGSSLGPPRCRRSAGTASRSRSSPNTPLVGSRCGCTTGPPA